MRLILIITIVVSFFYCVLSNASNKIKQTIKITEVCIVPKKTDFPKWIELQSSYKIEKNLKGYALYDRKKCIYKFSADYFVKPNGFVLMCFYNGDDVSKEFEKDLNATIKPINVFKTNVFAPREAIPFPVDKMSVIFPPFKDDLKKDILGRVPKAILEKYKSQAVKFNAEHKTNYKTDDLMSWIALTPPYFDEIALLNPNGEILSFLKWEGCYNEEKLSPISEIAKNKLGWEKWMSNSSKPVTSMGYNIIDKEPVVFSCQHKLLYTSINPRYASPGKLFSRKGFINDANNSPAAIEIDINSKEITMMFDNIKSGFNNWGIEIEISGDEKFTKNNFILKKSIKILKYSRMVAFQLTDGNLEKLKEYNERKRLFYQVRRIFPDDTFSEWQKGIFVKSLNNVNDWKSF